MAEKKPKKEITFARPAFAQEVMTEEGRRKFDALPAWQRHMFKRLLDHGDLGRAAQEAGVSTYVNKNIDAEKAQEKNIREVLNEGGLTAQAMIPHLLECLEARTIRFDKHQNPMECTDLSLKLKTIQFIAQLHGLFDQKPKDDGKGKGVEQLFDDTPV